MRVCQSRIQRSFLHSNLTLFNIKSLVNTVLANPDQKKSEGKFQKRSTASLSNDTRDESRISFTETREETAE